MGESGWPRQQDLPTPKWSSRWAYRAASSLAIKMHQQSSLIHTQPQTGNSPNVHQQRNGITDCDRFLQWDPTQHHHQDK